MYRFAVLLAGASEPAQAAVVEVFADAGEKIHHFRSGKSCLAWLVAKLRNRLLKHPPTAAPAAPPDDQASDKPENATTAAPDLNPQALALADRFCKIPEPGRSALALLYLDQFSVQEIAQILQMNIEELAEAVESARSLLRQMDAVQKAAATTSGEEAQS